MLLSGFTGTDGLSAGLHRLRVDVAEHLLSARAGAVILGEWGSLRIRKLAEQRHESTQILLCFSAMASPACFRSEQTWVAVDKFPLNLNRHVSRIT
jgi:hypothetical protein